MTTLPDDIPFETPDLVTVTLTEAAARLSELVAAVRSGAVVRVIDGRPGRAPRQPVYIGTQCPAPVAGIADDAEAERLHRTVASRRVAAANRSRALRRKAAAS